MFTTLEKFPVMDNFLKHLCYKPTACFPLIGCAKVVAILDLVSMHFFRVFKFDLIGYNGILINTRLMRKIVASAVF